jgi:taurine dioxygenase
LLLVTNKPRGDKPWDGHTQGQTWHSDQSCTLYPSPGTFVLAKELPQVGGTTLFANQYLAYETLSPALQKILDGLEAVHDLGTTAQQEKQRDFAATNLTATPAYEDFGDPPVVHPVVKVHPETGRRALYVDDRVRNFAGMTEEETKPLLGFLLEHAVRYEFTYRHVWRENDLILWDNRCLLHRALVDYDQMHQYRHMWRCALRGEKSGYLANGKVFAC